MREYDVKLDSLNEDWEEIKLPFSHYIRSFVSGDPSGDRIRVKYYKSPEAGVLFGRIWFGPGAEGPPGYTHGGAQAAAIDEICGGAVWVHGYAVVAVKLETEFLTFVPLQTELVLRGTIKKREGRKIYTEGRIETLDGAVLSQGQALFLELNEEQRSKLSGLASAKKLPEAGFSPPKS